MGWIGANERKPHYGETVITRAVVIYRNGETVTVEALREYRPLHWYPALEVPLDAISAQVTHWHPYENYTLLYRQGSEEKHVDRVKHISSPIERGIPEEHHINLWSGETIYADELLGALDEQGNPLWMKEEEEP